MCFQLVQHSHKSLVTSYEVFLSSSYLPISRAHTVQKTRLISPSYTLPLADHVSHSQIKINFFTLRKCNFPKWKHLLLYLFLKLIGINSVQLVFLPLSVPIYFMWKNHPMLESWKETISLKQKQLLFPLILYFHTNGLLLEWVTRFRVYKNFV